jgi:hypothetical protein
MTLHNFIRESAIVDAYFDRRDWDENYMPMPDESSSELRGGNRYGGGEDHNMDTFRDSIANALFARRE